jgi:hypothetical protein
MEKSTNIQYPSIFTRCNAPALRHYPTIPRLSVPKRGRRPPERQGNAYRYSYPTKKKEKEKREEKKTTLGLCLHPKVAVHTYFHTSDDTRER